MDTILSKLVTMTMVVMTLTGVRDHVKFSLNFSFFLFVTSIDEMHTLSLVA